MSNIHSPDGLLTFGHGNSKLDRVVDHISLPSGWSCPGAAACKSRAVEGGDGRWRIEDGPATAFRCFSATAEVAYAAARAVRWRNWELLRQARTARNMARLILRSIPAHNRPALLYVGGRAYANLIRGHIGGDFFNQSYFDAWLSVCVDRPDVLFYAYTKSLPFWVRRLDRLPDNFVLTASEGGKYDDLITRHNLRFARVVFSAEEASAAGLPIDHDDSHAMLRGGSFALLLHGTQPGGTEAASALQALHAAGHFGYSRADRGKRVSLPLA